MLDLIKQQEVNKAKFILSLLLFHNNQIIRKVIWQQQPTFSASHHNHLRIACELLLLSPLLSSRVF